MFKSSVSQLVSLFVALSRVAVKYLILHYDTFYFRRKLQHINICLSLKTKNIQEAKYILSIINSKLEIMREVVSFEEEIDYIKNLLKKYIDIAKQEYGEFATKRSIKYSYTKENGRKISGSHPQAIEYHLQELQDSVYSDNKEQVVQDIIKDSNISQEYKQAIKELSPEGCERLLDEVIKAELELLCYDQTRNEARTNPKKLQSTYIHEATLNQDLTAQVMLYNGQISSIKETIMETKKEEEKKYKRKTKEEIFEEYLEEIKEQKAKMLDKIIQPIKTLLQSAEHKYLVDYEINDYQIFFDSMIYTPTYLYEDTKIFKDYQGNYIQIAEDFRESLTGEENLLTGYIKDEKISDRLQSIANVTNKYNEINNFLDYCVENDYLKKNYIRDNSKFSSKKFEKVLKSTKKRKPFNDTELNLMFTKLAERIEQNFFNFEESLIPLVGLYSGMRVEEICKLRLEDIKQEPKTGIWYFDINGFVKTESSEREVPIHSQLIDKFHFLDYLEYRKRENATTLFNLKSVYHKDRVKFSHYFLRDFFYPFRDSFVSEERIDNDLVSFHSFRHTFGTRLNSGRVPFFEISKLLGHTVDTVLETILQIKIKQNETPNYVHSSLTELKTNIEQLNLSDIQHSINQFSDIYRENFIAFRDTF